MNQLLVPVLALLLCRCAGPAAAPPVVPVATVDANAPLVDPRAAPEVTVETLQGAFDETARLADAILSHCRAALGPEDRETLRTHGAAAFADRDELKMRRTRGGGLGDRDARAWAAQSRKNETALRELARRSCPAALE